MTSDKRRSYTAFYELSWGRTVACTYAITADLGVAEEIAQEAYIRAWSRWSRISAYDEPGAWVRQVATRLAISQWRRGRVARSFLTRVRTPEPVPGPDESSVALARALSLIPVSQRRAIVLHHLADLSVAEVASLENCPVGTIKARLARGRDNLAVHLDPTAPGTPDTAIDPGTPHRNPNPATTGLENSHV